MISFLQQLDPKIPSTSHVQFPIDMYSVRTNIAKVLKARDEEEQTNLDLNKELQENYRKFHKQIETISNLYGSAIRNCDPSNMHSPSRKMFLQFFENGVKRCLVNSPENKILEEKWKEFQENFFKLRFNFSQYVVQTKESHELLTKAQAFSELIKNETKKIRLQIPPEELDREEKILNLFNHILKTNDILLDVPLGALAGICDYTQSEPTLITCIPYLVKSYNQQLELILNNLPWVLQICEEKLKPFAKFEQDNCMNYSQKLLKIIKEIRKKFPKLQHLYLESSLSCSPDKQKEILDLIEFFQEWAPADLGKEIETVRIGEKFFTKFTCGFGYFVSNKQYTCLEDYYQKLVMNRKQNSYEGIYSKENLGRLKRSVEFHHVANECAHLMSGFFRFPILSMSYSYPIITKWCDEEKVRLARSKYEAQSVVELAKSIEGDKKIKKSKRKKKAQQTPSQTSSTTTSKSIEVQNSPQTKSEVVEIISKMPAVPSFSKDVQIVQKLIEAVKSTSDPMIKASARQAQMYAQDILTVNKNLQSASNDSSLLYFLITLLQSEFFHLEQILNYQGLSGGVEKTEMQKDHNLLSLLERLGIQSSNKNAIIDDLFLANFWIRSLYEQLHKRENWNIPPYLHTIQHLYEAGKLSQQTTLFDRIKQTYQKTINFSSELPVITSSSSQKVLKIEVDSFQYTTEIALKPCEEIAKKCQNLFNRLSTLWHPKLKQVLCHLKVLQGIIYEINKKKIDSDAFSLLVRNFLFWENTILEEVLQLAYGQKTGVDSYSHDLGTLYKELITHKTVDCEQEYEFLDQTMANLHNFSRYPFIHHGSEFIRTLILQAELLRERPELGKENPFILTKNITDLNYLEVPTDHFTPDSIVNKLNEIHMKIFQIISKRLLPRINNG